jgi:uncharacterized delta-60 repeat protein
MAPLHLTRLEDRDTPAGNVDLSFTGDGRQTTDFSSASDKAAAVVVQPDGKILVAGSSSTTSVSDIAVARYHPNGSLDTSFDGDGKQTIDFGGAEWATSMVLQADGKIVLAGHTSASANGGDFAVARLNPNGSLDTTFSGDGKQTIDIGSYDQANGIAIQPDGKMVLAGYFFISGTTSEAAVARLNANGTLDTTFSGDGKQQVNFGGDDRATAVALQADGKVLLAGFAFVNNESDFVVARLNANGTPDTTFSGDGLQTVAWSANDLAWAVAVQSDGKILAAGVSAVGNNRDFAVARLTASGALDPTFSGDGKQQVDFGTFDGVRALAVQPDGRIVLAGYADAGNAYDFGVARLNANGTPDTSFSGDGKIQVNFGDDDEAFGVALAADGDIVLAGNTTGSGTPSGTDDFAVARLVGRDTGFVARTPFDGRWYAYTPTATANGFAVQPAALATWDSAAGWKDVRAGDVNGDGRSDVAGRNAAGQWWVVASQPDGTFTNTQWAGWWEGAGWKDVTLADVTGDGKADVIGRTSSGAWFVGVSTGSGFVTSQWAAWWEPAGWKDVKFSDLNADGRADVLARTSSGVWFAGVSTGTAFATAQWATWYEPAGWQDVNVADVNADGRADVIARTASGSWFVGTSTGSGFVTTPWASWYEPAGWKDVRFADVTGDGRADLIARTSGGSWYVGASTGTAFTLTSSASWYEPAGWKDIRTGDFNGDGRADVMARTAGGSWFVGTSNGLAFTFTLWASWYEPYNWADVLTGTFVG